MNFGMSRPVENPEQARTRGAADNLRQIRGLVKAEVAAAQYKYSGAYDKTRRPAPKSDPGDKTCGMSTTKRCPQPNGTPSARSLTRRTNLGDAVPSRCHGCPQRGQFESRSICLRKGSIRPGVWSGIRLFDFPRPRTDGAGSRQCAGKLPPSALYAEVTGTGPRSARRGAIDRPSGPRS